MNSLNSLILSALAALSAASASAKVMEDTVAVVNGTPILLSEYQKELSSALDYWGRAEPEAMRDPANLKKLRESTLEQLVDREVLYQEGGRQKIKVRERDIENGINEIKQRFAKDETGRDLSEAETEAVFQKQLKTDGLNYAQFRERLGKQIMARKLLDEAVRPKVKSPEDKEVKAYFERVKDFILSQSSDAPKGLDEESAAAFRQIVSQIKALSSERVRVSRILVKLSPRPSANEKKRALKTAQDIRRRLIDGTSTFAEVARAESEDPESAGRGGDVGYVIRGVAPPEFEKAAFSLPVGEISEPIETEIGYHIIRVQEKRASETPEFERFKEDLSKFLMNIAYQKELDAYVKSVKAKAVVERNLPSVP